MLEFFCFALVAALRESGEAGGVALRVSICGLDWVYLIEGEGMVECGEGRWVSA